jgi:hypothetical protein
VTLQSLFDWLESWPVSVGIRMSSWMFPAFESVHVIAITLVVGSVMIVDLRVLGLTSTHRRVTQVSGEILPWTWAMFVIALVTGAFMFAAKAHAYAGNLNFQIKMALMALAGLNMLVFHHGAYKTVLQWDLGKAAPVSAKIGCGVSLGFWTVIVIMGRWIGFTIMG